MSKTEQQQWREPETGGEAYIPLHPMKRRRLLASWGQVGRQRGAHSPTGFHYSGVTKDGAA